MKHIYIIALILAAAVAGCRITEPSAEECWWRDDPATYYSGDGFGVNLYLTLQPSNSYHLIWSGCLGVYGRAQGAWQEIEGTIELRPEIEQGELTNSPLRVLAVSTNTRGHRCLVFPTNSFYAALDPMFTRNRLAQYQIEYEERERRELEQAPAGDALKAAPEE